MTMPVTADQVAAIRAYLEGDFERHKRLHGQLDRNAGLGYSALLTAAFSRAVQLRFPKGTKASDVIDYVGEVRARYEWLGDQLDTRAAERFIRSMLTDEDVDDIDSATSVKTQFYLLYPLVSEQELDEDSLDEFMAEARKLADEAIA